MIQGESCNMSIEPDKQVVLLKGDDNPDDYYVLYERS